MYIGEHCQQKLYPRKGVSVEIQTISSAPERSAVRSTNENHRGAVEPNVMLNTMPYPKTKEAITFNKGKLTRAIIKDVKYPVTNNVIIFRFYPPPHPSH